jgi:hypothetical protein
VSYHSWKDEEFGPVGSFEVWHYDGSEPEFMRDEEDQPLAAGWYWWACYPGCLPDGEPMGPFETEDAALRNAHDDE